MPTTTTRYDGVSIGVHWLTAILVLAQVIAGVTMVTIGRGPTQDILYTSHKNVGLILLALVLFRIAWRLGHPWPPLPASVSPLQAGVARINHALLYAVLIVMPVSGFVFTAAGGYPVPFLGLVELSGLVGKNEPLSKLAEGVHEAGKWAVYLLVGLHVAGGLHHLLVRKDGVFQRMLP